MDNVVDARARVLVVDDEPHLAAAVAGALAQAGYDVRQNRFREDLYYRLNVVHIESPPLRQRGDDVRIIAGARLAHHARVAAKQIDGFEPAAMEFIAKQRWPGNVRELDNAIERAVVFCGGRRITYADMCPKASNRDLHLPGATIGQIEKHAILATLESLGGVNPRSCRVAGHQPAHHPASPEGLGHGTAARSSPSGLRLGTTAVS